MIDKGTPRNQIYRVRRRGGIRRGSTDMLACDLTCIYLRERYNIQVTTMGQEARKKEALEAVDWPEDEYVIIASHVRRRDPQHGARWLDYWRFTELTKEGWSSYSLSKPFRAVEVKQIHINEKE